MKTPKLLIQTKNKRCLRHGNIIPFSSAPLALVRSMCLRAQKLRLAGLLASGLCLAHTGWSAPLAQSIAVTPDPLITGQRFTIAVTAAPDVTQATATVDSHPGQTPPLDIPLTNQGVLWIGSGVVPQDLRLNSNKDEGQVKVLLFGAGNRRDEEVIHIDVIVPTISAAFAGGVLTINGDNGDNTLIASRDVAGTLLVNGSAIPITGGTATVTNTTLIQIFGLAGNDVLMVDDSNGPMPPANLFGGEGDDVLTGSAADDMLDGGPGNDTLFGRDGNDHLIGGPGNDILIGGRGADTISGGDGDDQIIWNPGDGSDVVEGDGGVDTLVFNGANVGEQVDLSANGQRLRFFRDVGNITMDCNGVELVQFNALAGADIISINDLTGTGVTGVKVDLATPPGSATGDAQADTIIVNGTQTNDVITITGSTNEAVVNGLSTEVTVTGAESGLDNLVVNGLGGADRIDASALPAGIINLTLNGGAGDDVLIGSQGNDLLIGGPGSDTVFGGAGDDTFVWNPGDGSDISEGQDGHDTLLFNGANIGEKIDLSANGQRIRFFRDVANITMDCNGVESVRFNALGGADTITVNNLTGTDVKEVNLDLSATPGSGIGDGQADIVVVNGTAGNDSVTVNGTTAGVNVNGLSAEVNIVGSEPSLDQLVINLLGGDDVLTAASLPAGLITLTVDGGPGADLIIGSGGADVLLGGEGDDILIGGPGQDLLDGGPGNNVLLQD